MDLCAGHGLESIAYIGNTCPACDHIEELTDEFRAELDNLHSELQEAQDREVELQSEVDELRAVHA